MRIAYAGQIYSLITEDAALDYFDTIRFNGEMISFDVLQGRVNVLEADCPRRLEGRVPS